MSGTILINIPLHFEKLYIFFYKCSVKNFLILESPKHSSNNNKLKHICLFCINRLLGLVVLFWVNICGMT